MHLQILKNIQINKQKNIIYYYMAGLISRAGDWSIPGP